MVLNITLGHCVINVADIIYDIRMLLLLLIQFDLEVSKV